MVRIQTQRSPPGIRTKQGPALAGPAPLNEGEAARSRFDPAGPPSPVLVVPSSAEHLASAGFSLSVPVAKLPTPKELVAATGDQHLMLQHQLAGMEQASANELRRVVSNAVRGLQMLGKEHAVNLHLCEQTLLHVEGRQKVAGAEAFLKSSPTVVEMSISEIARFAREVEMHSANVSRFGDLNAGYQPWLSTMARGMVATLSGHREAAAVRSAMLVEPTRDRIRSGEYGLEAIRADLDTDGGEALVLTALGVDKRPFYKDRSNPPPRGEIHHPSNLRGALNALVAANVGSADTFYDLGSGSGQVAFLARLATGARCKGVEFDSSLHDLACQNSRELNLREVVFIHADAATVDYSDGTAFYFYPPFSGPVLATVLERLRQVAADHPITLITCGMQLQEPWLSAPEVTKNGWQIQRSMAAPKT